MPLQTRPPFIWSQSLWGQGYWSPVVQNQTNTMPVQNISAQFTPQAFTDVKADIVAIAPQFPALVTLTDAERKALPRVAAGREAFCDTAYTGAQNFPAVVPGFISAVEWGKDETYYTQLGELEILVESLLAKIRDTKGVCGTERYRQSRKFYEAVKSAKEDVAGLQALYEALRDQFDGQGGSGEGDGGGGDGGGDGGAGGGAGGGN